MRQNHTTEASRRILSLLVFPKLLKKRSCLSSKETSTEVYRFVEDFVHSIDI